jgi:hypothetical protein
MLDYSETAREELKRVDHLVYVSLKYTRTVDVIKSIIDRLISAINFIITDLIEHRKDQIIEEIPEAPAARASIVGKIYLDDATLKEMIEFYLSLRKLSRAEYKKINEYRRHVTMIAALEEQELNVDIDLITEYYNKTKGYWEYVEKTMRGINE